jgi:hypothetical protein
MDLNMSKRLTQICPRKSSSQLLSAGPHLCKKRQKIHRWEPPKLFSNPIVTQMPDHVLYVARARGGSGYPKFLMDGMGYLAEQSTKPQTIGLSLTDSLVGLLAWIYEKLVI